MVKNILIILSVLVTIICICDSCLITNCPRGGKRSHFHRDNNIKPCISCGPGRTGQCFGSNICCGPFGCLFGTSETTKCQREGLFQEPEPCIAGTGYCRKNTGRCAGDGICCTQESCHIDKSCAIDEKARIQEMESLYNIFSAPLLNQIDYSNDISNV